MEQPFNDNRVYFRNYVAVYVDLTEALWAKEYNLVSNINNGRTVQDERIRTVNLFLFFKLLNFNYSDFKN